MPGYIIPGDDDFARADKWMAERDRELAQVSENVKRRFMAKCPLHNVYVLWQRDVDFRAYIFFRSDTDVIACENSGVTALIKKAVREELERCGRGQNGELTVDFECDSDENVGKHYDGDYLLRLR